MPERKLTPPWFTWKGANISPPCYHLSISFMKRDDDNNQRLTCRHSVNYAAFETFYLLADQETMIITDNIANCVHMITHTGKILTHTLTVEGKIMFETGSEWALKIVFVLIINKNSLKYNYRRILYVKHHVMTLLTQKEINKHPTEQKSSWLYLISA